MGRVMGVVGVPMLMGPIIGPVLGGWLVDDVSWRWIFYVNIPIGAVALVAALRAAAARRARPPHERLDWLGLALLSPGLAAFVYGLAETASSRRLRLRAGAGCPMIAGAAADRRVRAHALRARPAADRRPPVQEQDVVRGRRRTTFVFAAAFFGAMFCCRSTTRWSAASRRWTPACCSRPRASARRSTMPIAGKLTDQTGAGRSSSAGLALLMLGMLGFTQVGADTSFWLLGSAQFLMGLGMGAAMMPAMTAAYQTLAARRRWPGRRRR